MILDVIETLAGRRATHLRYRLKGEVAHGGMGSILRVWDEDLRRHLAMKVIRERDSDDDEASVTKSVGRFLEEAQVTGQLDHPGIVPVHELGVDEDGQVFFTMRLVKGRTLADVFELVTEGESGWTKTRALGVVLTFLAAGRAGVPRRFAVHLPEWASYSAVGGLFGALVVAAGCIFLARFVARVRKAA